MASVKQYDKRSAITYAYEATYHWDKEKQQSQCKRKLIGRVNPDTEEIVPTNGRNRKDKITKPTLPAKRGPITAEHSKHLYYGATYLFEKLSDTLGLTSDLRARFSNPVSRLRNPLILKGFFIVLI